MSDDDNFIQEELKEVMRGNMITVKAHELTVGVLRQIIKTAVLKNVTGVEITDTGHPVPFRISVRQLRSIILNDLKDASDDTRLDLGVPPLPGQPLH